jgi:hypothetical protein
MLGAAVYLLRDRILLHPYQRTTVGLGLASEPYITLGLDCPSDSLGVAVLDALSQSGRTVPHPTTWNGLTKPLISAAGAKSWRELQMQARYVGVTSTTEGVRIEPSHNGGSKAGFTPLPACATVVSLTATTTEIGATIRGMLERCT